MTESLAHVPPTLQATRSTARYDDLTITLHWLTVALVLAQFLLAEFWGFAPRAPRHLMIVTHMSFGMLLTAVLIARITWRLAAGRRLPALESPFLELVSKAVHGLLYGLLAAEAVLGFTLRWSGNEAMSFFGLLIPPPFAPFSKAAHHQVGEFHNWIAWTIILAAAAHAAAALFHRFILQDGVLYRMLPGRFARPTARQT